MLRDLDRIEAVRAADPSASVEAGDPVASRAGARRPLLTGFLFGAGLVGLVAVLVFWAGRDAQPRPEEAVGAPGSGREAPHPAVELPPQVAAEVEQLVARIAAQPQDVDARKRLALIYLASEQYVAAFEQAGAVLDLAPDDIDSHYVQGVVRMTMGQDDIALAHLDRVLELFPDHVRAMTVEGLIYARRGARDRAAALWKKALDVGGPQPEIENLLARLENEPADVQPIGLPASHPPTGVAADVYRIRVEAETLPGFPQTGSVFVALRNAAGGPPVAVKKIDRPVFPLDVVLGADDTMTGGELPDAGILSVRLDQDGSASTRGDNDLEGSVEATRGEAVTVVLE